MIKPCSFLVIELCTRLGAMLKREFVDEGLHIHQLRIVTGVPAEECQEVDDSLGEVSLFPVTRRSLARFGIVPLEGEHRETELVTVTLRELTVADRFEQKGKVYELRHGVRPAESLIEEFVERSRG